MSPQRDVTVRIAGVDAATRELNAITSAFFDVTLPLPVTPVPPETRERINEGHVAVRFDDCQRIWREKQHWHVTLDGEHVGNRVDEAYAGREDGWVRFVVTDLGGSIPVITHKVKHGDVRVWTCSAIDAEGKCTEAD